MTPEPTLPPGSGAADPSADHGNGAEGQPQTCEEGTGWMFCAHAEDSLTVCRCTCTCLDQTHCPRRTVDDFDTALARAREAAGLPVSELAEGEEGFDCEHCGDHGEIQVGRAPWDTEECPYCTRRSA